MQFLDQQGGWGNAQRLIDGNQYVGWDTNNGAGSSAKFTTGGATTLREIALWAPTDQAGRAITAQALRPDGSVAETKEVSLTGTGWHRATFNASGVDHVRLMRGPGENAFELKACRGNAPESVSISGKNASGQEGDVIPFEIRLTAPSQQIVTVLYEARSATAIAGSDFVAKTGTLTFQPGQTKKIVMVSTIDDAESEPDEDFRIALSRATNATIARGAVGFITDNDGLTSADCTMNGGYKPGTVAGNNKQNCVPSAFTDANGAPILISHKYEDWRGKVSTLTPVLSGSCKDEHDKYWVMGPDDKAYHTWHPAKDPDTGCVFQHEHGMDPAASKVFDTAGGYPPFGYVHQQLHVEEGVVNPHGHPVGDQHARHEDHFGHKVYVANDTRRATFRPQDGNGREPSLNA